MLVDHARQHGFTNGLPPTAESPTVRQEGLYSFLVRLLTAHDRGGTATDSTALSPLRPEGVSPSQLVQ